MSQVEAHYNRNAGREWERLERHRTEFAVTCRLLEEYLPHPPGQILDVGSGPGRYALHLTRSGYRVTLVDISQACLDLAIEKATSEGIYLSAPILGNAVALPAELDGLFDAVLLMGPLYHLMAAEERLAAITEAHRVLRPGGYVAASFITRFAPLRDVAIHSPQWILDYPERYRQLVEEGLNPAVESSAFPDSYFIHPQDIEPLMKAGGFHMETVRGCEGLLAGHEEAVNSLTGELWEAWVDLNYRLSGEPTLFGASDHLMYIGSKPHR